MIILESDFFDESHKIYVEGKFRENGLEKIHSEPLLNQPEFIMKKFPKMCTDSFFEVWMR